MKPKSKQYIETRKQYIGNEKQYIDKIITAGLTKKTAANAMKLFSEFKLEKIFSRTDGAPVTPASTLLKKLAIYSHRMRRCFCRLHHQW